MDPGTRLLGGFARIGLFLTAAGFGIAVVVAGAAPRPPPLENNIAVAALAPTTGLRTTQDQPFGRSPNKRAKGIQIYQLGSAGAAQRQDWGWAF